MTIHRPPRLATWILKRLGSTVIEDALVGDLFEAYQTRRSPFWYWREVGMAMDQTEHRVNAPLPSESIHIVHDRQRFQFNPAAIGCAFIIPPVDFLIIR